MTPARHAEIRAYIRRLDLDQLPGWTVEQRIIADLWNAAEEVRKLHEPFDVAKRDGTITQCCDHCSHLAQDYEHWPCATIRCLDGANPYRDGERQ
jgi:hypothetical protein